MALRVRLFVSLTSLSVLAFALLSNSSSRPVRADDGMDCPVEGECTFAKPNVLIAVEYSDAMNLPFDARTTRWEHVVQTLVEGLQPSSFIEQNFHVALLRFGHDPDPQQPGTPLPGTDLVDGLALDHAWTDPDTLEYLECQGPELLATLDALPAPVAGTGAWTRGALVRVAELVEQTRAAKGEVPDDRAYVTLVFTQGTWTNAEGDTPLEPAQDDPVEIAALLHDMLGVPVYVSEVGNDPVGEAAADALAAAGGTGSALQGTGEFETLFEFLQDIADQVVAPDCTADRPRILIVLDASSSMLNLDGAPAPQGTSAWDRARSLVVDFDGVLEGNVLGAFVTDFTLTGLLVSGGPVPEEQRVLVPYGRCYLDEFAWSLDPETSCEAPLCRDPWGAPPIPWTPSTTLAANACGFDEPPVDIHSHMPRCDGPGPACAGSGSFLHLGLQLAASYQAQAHAAGQEPDAELPTDDSTRYVNVLITDGYFGDSTDAQVQTALEAMFTGGITTRVIGIGELLGTPEFEAQLTAMAAWGSGGAHGPSYADDPSEVRLALVGLVEASMAEADPCCPYFDCHSIVECLDEEDDDSSGETESESDSTESESSESATGESESDSTETESSESDDSSASTGPGDEIGDDSTGGGIDLPDRGCSCTSEAPGSAAPASLILLALLGLRRRRR
jgi:MYXO-CTERM domain-containing protein